MISLPRVGPPDLLEHDTLLRGLRTVVAACEPDRAWVLTKRWRRKLREAGADLAVGWLSYFDCPASALQGVPATVVPMQPRGVLVSLGDAMPDADDEAALDLGRQVLQALRSIA